MCGAPPKSFARSCSDRASQEEVDETALQVGRVLRVLAFGWLSYHFYKIASGASKQQCALPDRCPDEMIVHVLTLPSLALSLCRHVHDRTIAHTLALKES